MLMTDMNSRCKTNHNLFEFNSIKLMITITNLQHVELYFFIVIILFTCWSDSLSCSLIYTWGKFIFIKKNYSLKWWIKKLKNSISHFTSFRMKSCDGIRKWCKAKICQELRSETFLSYATHCISEMNGKPREEREKEIKFIEMRKKL